MAALRKGLGDLHTLSGRVDQDSLSYRAYMKVTCLEMEKVRRGRERASARQRIANIDARLKEVEAEKAALLQSVEGRTGDRSLKLRGLEVRSAPRRSMGGLKIRY
jgi:hypothetical protein